MATPFKERIKEFGDFSSFGKPRQPKERQAAFASGNSTYPRTMALVNVDSNNKDFNGKPIIDKVGIRFVPQELNFNPDLHYAVIQSMGRNNPFYHYTGGEDTLSFTIDWHAMDKNRARVIASCSKIVGWAKNDGYNGPPCRIKLVFGDIFKDSIWIIKKAPFRLTQFTADGFRPIQAYQEIELARISSFNLTRRGTQAGIANMSLFNSPPMGSEWEFDKQVPSNIITKA